MTIENLIKILESYTDIPQEVLSAIKKCIIVHQYVKSPLNDSNIIRMKSNKGKIKKFYQLKIKTTKDKKEVFYLGLKDETDSNILLFMLLDNVTFDIIYLIYCLNGDLQLHPGIYIPGGESMVPWSLNKIE